MRYIKIPVSQDMEEDLRECGAVEAEGKEKECWGCSLNAGDDIGCLADHEWCREGDDKDGKEKETDTGAGTAAMPGSPDGRV